MVRSIRFPAIELSNTFAIADRVADSATAAAWRNGFFNRLAYFDSEGRLWDVHAVPQRPMTMLDRLLNSRIAATVTFTQAGGDGMAQAKRRICEMIDDDPGDLYDQFITRDELKRQIMAAATPQELMSIVQSMGYMDEPKQPIRKVG